MKLTMAKSVLENMLSSLQAFLEKRDNSQITSHILLKSGFLRRSQRVDPLSGHLQFTLATHWIFCFYGYYENVS